MKNAKPEPTPSEGGRYLRDPETGALTRIVDKPEPPAETETPPASPVKPKSRGN